MPFLDLKEEILDPEMCTRCGACVAVCPPNWLALDDEGVPTPIIDPDAMACGECSLCLQSCPGRDTATPGSETRIFGRARTRAERWTGIYRQSLLLTSTDPRVLAASSAGGAGVSLLIAALRSGLVEAVIVVGREAGRPWVPSALVTDNEDEVIRCGQSSYCLTPNLQLLRDGRFSRLAVVGMPCEIQAIQKMKSLNPIPDVADKVVLMIEIACASSTRRAGTEYLITERLGIDLKDVTDMRYRAGEYPGEFAVKTGDGRRRSVPFFEAVDIFKRFKTHRCLTCGDWWSGLADVSICDGDPNIYASSQSGARPPRHSMMLVRTALGEDLVQTAVQLQLASIAERPFVAEDNLGLQRKRFRHASFAQSMPDRVPTAPVDYQETDELLSDTEVIDRMAYHTPIGKRPEAAAAASRPDGTLVQIALDPASASEIVWRPPGDKAIAQRAAFAAALADGTSSVRNFPRSEDIEHNLALLRQLGVDVWEAADASVVLGGLGLRGLKASAQASVLNPGNSATSARILIGLLAGTPGEFRIDGNKLLRKRPMEWIVDPLRQAGANIDYESEPGHLPTHISGTQLRSICHQVEIASAQPVSALLFASLQATGESVIARRVRARDHTERLLRHLGVVLHETDTAIRLIAPERLPPFNITLPGDVSAAAFPIACVVASPVRKRLVIENVGLNETRIGFVRILQSMGAGIEMKLEGTEGSEPVGRIVVESGHPLRGIEVSGAAFIQSMIDELPLLAALAARASGLTVIRDAKELKDKDTDRIATTVATLRTFGVRIEPRDDGFEIEDSVLASPGTLQLPPDHRVIFAAMALASSLKEPTTMSGWERVSVSLPNCLDVVGKLASAIRLDSTCER